MEKNIKTFSVTELNGYVKNILLNDVILNNIFVTGEVVGLKKHFSGHLYFSLKDNDASIHCVMFKNSVQYLPYPIDNGMKVVLSGNVTLYPKTGSFQITCKTIKPFGVGDLQIKIDQLKAKLDSEGLFDVQLKKALPLYPKNVGIVTSDTGSVLQDILNVSNRRNKNIKVHIYHTQVQGENAHYEIAKAIDNICKNDFLDIVIVARGGGSFLDLLPFNEEIVARSIANASIPIISAIGHETDFTIADFVADRRCATPSEAAEVAFPNAEELKEELFRYNEYLYNLVARKYIEDKNNLDLILNKEVFRKPESLIEKEREKINSCITTLTTTLDNTVKKEKESLIFKSRLLESNNPINNLIKGYSITSNENNNIVKSINEVDIGNNLITTMQDGEIVSIVAKKIIKG